MKPATGVSLSPDGGRLIQKTSKDLLLPGNIPNSLVIIKSQQKYGTLQKYAPDKLSGILAANTARTSPHRYYQFSMMDTKSKSQYHTVDCRVTPPTAVQINKG